MREKFESNVKTIVIPFINSFAFLRILGAAIPVDYDFDFRHGTTTKMVYTLKHVKPCVLAQEKYWKFPLCLIFFIFLAVNSSSPSSYTDHQPITLATSSGKWRYFTQNIYSHQIFGGCNPIYYMISMFLKILDAAGIHKPFEKWLIKLRIFFFLGYFLGFWRIWETRNGCFHLRMKVKMYERVPEKCDCDKWFIQYKSYLNEYARLSSSGDSVRTQNDRKMPFNGAKSSHSTNQCEIYHLFSSLSYRSLMQCDFVLPHRSLRIAKSDFCLYYVIFHF